MGDVNKFSEGDNTDCVKPSRGFMGKLLRLNRIFHRKSQYLKDSPEIRALHNEITQIIHTIMLDGSNSGNIASVNYLSKIPLKFTHRSLERLYSYNINELIQPRVFILGLSMLILTLVIWPFSAITLKNSAAWLDDFYVIVFLHVAMALTAFLYLVLTITSLTKSYHLCELFSLLTFGSIITIWGVWHFVAGIFLKDDFEKSLMRGVSVSNEAMHAFNFIYGIVPIVALDTILPTRTIYTWWIHLSFLLLYPSSLITVCIINLTYIPLSYTFLRILAYVLIIFMLLIGAYASEFQSRLNFFNWLITCDKISQLESQVKSFKNNSIVTPAELIVERIKRCAELSLSLETANKGQDPELETSLKSVTDSLKQCLDLISTSNLYSVPITNIPNDAQKVINAYVTNNPDENEMEKFKKSQTIIIKDQNLVQRYHDIVVRRNNTIENDSQKIDSIPLPYGTGKLRNMLKRLNPPVIPSTEGLDPDLKTNWNFNILNHFKTHNDPFCSIAQFFLNDFFTETGIDSNVSTKFLRLIESLYCANPYHNAMHGVMVAQKMVCLANYANIYDKMSVLDRAAFFISGLCHDVAHPGRNNMFYINNMDSISILYNDYSVLENYHASCTFKVLEMPETNIFQNLSKKDFIYCRSMIVNLILATDMSNHFEIMSKFRLLQSNLDKESSSESLLATQKLMIKAADLSSNAVPWNESLEWVQRLLIEFYAQGDDEAALGLPISPLCDRRAHDEVPKSQVSFLKFVILPLFEHLDELEGKDSKIRSICIRNLNDNIAIWEHSSSIPLLDDSQYKLNHGFVDLELLL